MRWTANVCRLCRYRHNRHSFAVHRLIHWYQQGADVQRLLHYLSVYLTMTADLLQQAGSRFERYAARSHPPLAVGGIN